jgi:hypothetical protein
LYSVLQAIYSPLGYFCSLNSEFGVLEFLLRLARLKRDSSIQPPPNRKWASSSDKMVLHNPNNWHWVNKNALEWAHEYFSEKLVGLAASKGELSARVDKVSGVEGDCDVSQRKGKVITLFDVKVRLEFSGKLN